MNEEHLKIQQSPESVNNLSGPVIDFKRPTKIERYDVEESEYIYQIVQTAAAYIRKRVGLNEPITIGIICGSGLHEISQIISDKVMIPLSDIPGMPSSLVQGHQNFVNIGTIGNRNVICFQGRCHYYEGHPMWKVSLSMNIIKCLGGEIVFVTNSSGGLNSSYKVGDIMVIKDHISIPCVSGQNPLRGENDPRCGVRFPDMSKAYDPKLRKMCRKVINDLSLQNIYHEGIYCMSAGPSYETKAEIRMFQLIGGDAIGMSTTPEVITAVHSGLKVCGLTLISNVLNYDTHCYDLSEDEDEVKINGSAIPTDLPEAGKKSERSATLNHEDVLNAASLMGKRVADIIRTMVTNYLK